MRNEYLQAVEREFLLLNGFSDEDVVVERESVYEAEMEEIQMGIFRGKLIDCILEDENLLLGERGSEVLQPFEFPNHILHSLRDLEFRLEPLLDEAVPLGQQVVLFLLPRLLEVLFPLNLGEELSEVAVVQVFLLEEDLLGEVLKERVEGVSLAVCPS